MEKNKDENLEKLWEELMALKNKDQNKNTGKLGQVNSYEYVYNNKDVLKIKETAKKMNNFRDDLTREQKAVIDEILDR